MGNRRPKPLDDSVPPSDKWKMRSASLIVAYPQMSRNNFDMMYDLLRELVDQRGIPVPAIFFTEHNKIALQWVIGEKKTGEGLKGALNITDILEVEIDETSGYHTYVGDMKANTLDEQTVSTHSEIVQIISAWDFTHAC
ncbi:MAG: hypothetical protein H9W81_03350 [Enterococcus sp.]|nr:hypothetical protein [Enterococcus sp.]